MNNNDTFIIAPAEKTDGPLFFFNLFDGDAPRFIVGADTVEVEMPQGVATFPGPVEVTRCGDRAAWRKAQGY